MTDQAQTESYNYKLIKVIGKGTYSTVYLCSSTVKRVEKANSNISQLLSQMDITKEELKVSKDVSVVSQISEGL